MVKIKINTSKTLTIVFIFIIFFHLFETVFDKQTGQKLLNINRPTIGFPFTESFYFNEISVFIHKKNRVEKLDYVSVVKDNFPLFVSRNYWVLFSRFYHMPYKQFSAGAQAVCTHLNENKIPDELITRIEFIGKRGPKNGFKKDYFCKY